MSIKREVKCWKCVKVGHYTNKCRVMQKINQLEDGTLKKNLLNILINSDHEETSSEELEEFEDNLELEQIETLSTSSSSSEEEDGYYLGARLCNCNDCKTISTLTKDQTFVLINIIDKLEESLLKDEFIRQLNYLIIKDENSRKEINLGSYTVKDLQVKIKTLKQEIQPLKTNDIALEYRMLELEGKKLVKKQKRKKK
ncbi:hypothetical protein CR513_58067, partial [Mucuna pruriens]